MAAPLFLRYLRKGTQAEITFAVGPVPKSVVGEVVEFDETSVALRCGDGVEFVPLSTIAHVRLVPPPGAPPAEGDDAGPAKGWAARAPQEQAPEEHAFDIFRGAVVLSPPEPSFMVRDLDWEDQQDVIRWKNRYEYASKIHEHARFVSDVPAVAGLAERLARPELYVLAGSLALKLGDDHHSTLAQRYFSRALSLGHPAAGHGLACVASRNADWAAAANALTRYAEAARERSDDLREVLCNIGRCLSNLVNRDLPGLAQLAKTVTGEDGRRTALLLLSYALDRTAPEAARRAAVGDVEGARQLTPGANVFRALPPMSTPPPPPRAPGAVSAGRRVGRVTAFFPKRAFGFLTEHVTQQIFFVHPQQIVGESLREELLRGVSGQRVSFAMSASRAPSTARYPAAEDVELQDAAGPAPSAQPEPAPPKTSAAGQATTEKRARPRPPEATAFSRAKSAELAGDLDAAREHFLSEINSNGPHKQSAIKDLAWLLTRTGKIDDALAILAQHRQAFGAGDLQSFENLLAQIYMKARRYDDAAQTYRRLQASAPRGRKLSLKREEAYCLFASSKFDLALDALDEVRAQAPFDMTTIGLIERVKQAHAAAAAGTISSLGADATLHAQFASGLSPFAVHVLASCDFHGADARARARNEFGPRDFVNVERRIKDLRWQARERGALWLTLAAMCRISPQAAGDRSIHECLRLAFLALGEAAIHDKLHRDTARGFLAESLYLSTSDGNVQRALSHLLTTYLTVVPEPGEPLQDRSFNVKTVLRRLDDDPPGWQAFERDFAYYSTVSLIAAKRLQLETQQLGTRPLSVVSSPERLEEDRTAEHERLQQELVTLRSLQGASLTLIRLQDRARTLLSVSEKSRFDLDKQRLRTLASFARDAASYWNERDFTQRESQYQRLLSALPSFQRDIEQCPTKLSVEALLPLIKHLQQGLDQSFEEYATAARPVLKVQNVLDLYVPRDGVIEVTLDIGSRHAGAPVEDLDVRVVEDEGLRLVDRAPSPEVLRGGEHREVQLSLRLSVKQLAELAFTLRVRLHYRTRGEAVLSDEHTIAIRLGAESSFQRIEPNPYTPYSGGMAVKSAAMFFGRQELLRRILDQVTGGPSGQCFVLYGQKRSGKTSVLLQLERMCHPPHLVVVVTIGVIDAPRAAYTFVRECLDQLWMRLAALGVRPPSWPDRESIQWNPMDAFRRGVGDVLTALQAGGWSGPRIVFLVDEFTYLYEYIKEGVIKAEFMRQWKALLELRLFSAVVAGQDSMPRFKQAFPNEFGITHDVRISYLSDAEARAMAEAPIRLAGQSGEDESRYRGKALERLLFLTAGSPYYMQIMCDQVVQHLNDMRSPFITEADINLVSRKLTSGENIMPIDRFDPLITAAGASVAEAPREVYLTLLTAIATASERGHGVLLSDLPHVPDRDRLIQDMWDREVLTVDATRRVAIRVGLFEQWLRENRGLADG